MKEPRWASLAGGCVRAARGLMDRGFFDGLQAGGFAFTFESGAPDVFGYVVPLSTGNPQIMLLRGGGAFPAFQAVMIPCAETVYFLDACEVFATGFDPFERVPPPYRPFILAGGVRHVPDQTTPFFFVEPPCSDRHGPNREEAMILLGLLRALETAHGRARLNLLPVGTGGGEFAVLHLSGPPDQPEVELRSGVFGTGLDLPGAGTISG